MEIYSLYAKINANTGNYDKALRAVRADAEKTEKAFDGLGNLGEKAFKAVSVAAIAAGAAIAGTIAKSVSAAGDLEQQAANISAVFGDAAPPINEVKDAINALALDPKLVVGVADAGAGLEMLAKNGLTWQQIADGAARSSILLSNATGADLATSADITTNALGIFGLGIENLDSVVATFVNSANKSQFAIEDWGYVLANAGPKAKAMGWALEDLFAAVTLTSSGFASGQTAGTSWAWLINGLTPSTIKAKDAMKELGLMTEDGANAFFNADGTAKSIYDTIGLLQGALKGLSTEQQMTYSETLFGSEAFGALSGALNINLDELRKLTPQMTDFAAVEKGAETRTNTYQAAMAALRDTINSVFSMIGDKFLPIFTKMARSFASFIKDNAQPIVDFFGRFADGLGAFVSDAGTWLGRLNNEFAFNFSIITSENATWGEKMLAIWDMLYRSGLKIWQSLLDGLLKLIPRWLGNLGEWALALWEWIKEATPKALTALWEWAKGLWGWLASNLPTWISNLWEWAKALWQWIVEVTPLAVTKLGEWFTAIVNYLGANLPSWIATFLGWATALWTWIGNVIPNALTALANFLAALRGEGAAGTSSLWEMVKGWAIALWTWITEVALPQIAPAFATFLQAVTTAGQNIWNALVLLGIELGKTLWWWITKVIPDVVTALAQYGAAIWGWLVQNGPSWFATLDAWGRAAWQWIAEAISPVTQWLGALWAEISNYVGQFNNLWAVAELANLSAWQRITLVWNEIKGVAAIIFRAISTVIENFTGGWINLQDILIGVGVTLLTVFWPAISAAFTAVMGAIGSFVAAFAPLLAIFATAVVASALLRTAWETDWGGIRTAVESSLTFLAQAFAPVVQTIREFGGQALQEIWAWVTGQETSFTAVKRIWESIKTAFGTVFTAIGQKLVEWGQVAWQWFNDKFPTAAGALMKSVNSIKANFGELWVALQPLWEKIKSAWATLVSDWQTGNGKIGTELQKLKNFLDNVWAMMVTAATMSINNLINVMTLIVQLINGDWEGAWNTAKEIVRTTWSALVDIVRYGVEAVLALFGYSIEDIRAWYDRTVGILRSWGERFRDWGGDIIEGLRRGLEEKWNSLANWFSGVWGELTDRFKRFFGIHSPSTLFAGYGNDMMSGLADGIAGASSKVYGALDTIGKGVSDMMGGTGKTITDVMAGLSTYVSSGGKANTWDTLNKAVGTDKAQDVLAAMRYFGSAAVKALETGNVGKSSLGYYYANNVKAAEATQSISTMMDNIVQLSQQLGEMGVGTTGLGAEAKKGLVSLTDLLSVLTEGGAYNSGYELAPEPSSEQSAMTAAILDALKAILQELRRGGTISESGFDRVVTAIGYSGRGSGGNDIALFNNHEDRLRR